MKRNQSFRIFHLEGEIGGKKRSAKRDDDLNRKNVSRQGKTTTTPLPKTEINNEPPH